jgi:putative heme-binding domain-containing protein
MIWYGIQPAVPADPTRAIELYNQSKSLIVRRYVARRLAEEIEQYPAMIDSLLASATDPVDVIAGMGEAFEGWSRATMPTNYTPAVERLSSQAKVALADTLRSIGIIFGDGRSTEELLALLKAGDLDQKRRAIRTLATSPSAELQSILMPMVADRELQVDVIRALSSFDDVAVADRILQSFPNLSDAGKESAVDTLVARAPFAQMLLVAMEAERLPRSTLAPFHARQIRAYEKPELTQLLTKVWGEVRSASESKTKVIATYKESTLSAEELSKGNLQHGRQLFNKQCAGCHVLFGQGRKLGPDLTGSQRKNIDYLLENLVDPSAVVAADFKAATVIMADGRSIQGVIARSNDRTITLQTKDQDLTFDRQEIEEIQTTGVSLMPEGILDSLAKDEVRDLVAYLMADHQVQADP